MVNTLLINYFYNNFNKETNLKVLLSILIEINLLEIFNYTYVIRITF